MPTKTLPERPSLTQLKLQATELRGLHRQKRLPAAARIVANHRDSGTRAQPRY